jgi:hypothetical protein
MTTSQKANYKGHEIVATVCLTKDGDWLPDAKIDGRTCEMFQIPHKDREDAYGRAFRTARDWIDLAEYQTCG